MFLLSLYVVFTNLLFECLLKLKEREEETNTSWFYACTMSSWMGHCTPIRGLLNWKGLWWTREDSACWLMTPTHHLASGCVAMSHVICLHTIFICLTIWRKLTSFDFGSELRDPMAWNNQRSVCQPTEFRTKAGWGDVLDFSWLVYNMTLNYSVIMNWLNPRQSLIWCVQNPPPPNLQ